MAAIRQARLDSFFSVHSPFRSDDHSLGGARGGVDETGAMVAGCESDRRGRCFAPSAAATGASRDSLATPSRRSPLHIDHSGTATNGMLKAHSVERCDGRQVEIILRTCLSYWNGSRVGAHSVRQQRPVQREVGAPGRVPCRRLRPRPPPLPVARVRQHPERHDADPHRTSPGRRSSPLLSRCE